MLDRDNGGLYEKTRMRSITLRGAEEETVDLGDGNVLGRGDRVCSLECMHIFILDPRGHVSAVLYRVVGVERVGVAQVPGVVHDDEVAHQTEAEHGQRDGPVAVGVIGHTQALQNPVGCIRPHDPYDCAHAEEAVSQHRTRTRKRTRRCMHDPGRVAARQPRERSRGILFGAGPKLIRLSK